MYFRVLLKRICNFILILPVAMFVSGFQPAMQNAIENPTPLGRFDLMTPTSGWVILGHQLFWTEDAGETWMDLSPSIPAEASIEDIYFMDNNTGWMLWSMMNPDGLFVFQIAHTQDHGVKWTVEELPFLAEAIPNPEKAEMGWFNPQTGWISVKQSTGSNFSTGALFTTQDGGASWDQSGLPIADEIIFSSPLEGWAVGGPSGNQIFRTLDSGETWQDLATMEIPAGGICQDIPSIRLR